MLRKMRDFVPVRMGLGEGEVLTPTSPVLSTGEEAGRVAAGR
jgi:hypothetical protein